MKLNWGHGIFLTIVFFISLLLYGVSRILFTKEADHQLISEKYYEEELDFQKNKKEIARGDSISDKIQITKINDRIIKIIFNKELTVIKGQIYFYCPFEKSNDFKEEFSYRGENMYTFQSDKLIKGEWLVKFSVYDSNGICYMLTKKIKI